MDVRNVMLPICQKKKQALQIIAIKKDVCQSNLIQRCSSNGNEYLIA